ncbi:MAG: helix-turn-helix domain-containing protein [Defluviimonas sp.]|nr:helix-turn-helix domain-containing protein [Defluviimonas sp.]
MVEDRSLASDGNAAAWEDACRRDDVLRALLVDPDKGRLGRREVAVAAEALGVSVATLYRMIARFRETRRVSSLLAKPCGWPTGRKRLDPEVEDLIRTEIKEFYC